MLWSPTTPTASANGFTNASPTGGNFVAADGAFGTAAITQTINGLVVGTTYAVSFAWAGEQYGFDGPISTPINGSFIGTATQSTAIVNVANHGFCWTNQTFNYVATSTSQVLSFLAAACCPVFRRLPFWPMSR